MRFFLSVSFFVISAIALAEGFPGQGGGPIFGPPRPGQLPVQGPMPRPGLPTYGPPQPGFAPVVSASGAPVISVAAPPIPVLDEANEALADLYALANDLRQAQEWMRVRRFRIAQPVWVALNIQPRGPVNTWTQGFVNNMVMPNFPTYPSIPVLEDQKPENTPDYWVSKRINDFQQQVILFADQYNSIRNAPTDGQLWEKLTVSFRELNIQYQNAMGSTFFYIEMIKRTYFFPGGGFAQGGPEELIGRLNYLQATAQGIFNTMHVVRAILGTCPVIGPAMPVNCFECTMTPFFPVNVVVNQPVGFLPFPFQAPGPNGQVQPFSAVAPVAHQHGAEDQFVGEAADGYVAGAPDGSGDQQYQMDVNQLGDASQQQDLQYDQQSMQQQGDQQDMSRIYMPNQDAQQQSDQFQQNRQQRGGGFQPQQNGGFQQGVPQQGGRYQQPGQYQNGQPQMNPNGGQLQGQNGQYNGQYYDQNGQGAPNYQPQQQNVPQRQQMNRRAPRRQQQQFRQQQNAPQASQQQNPQVYGQGQPADDQAPVGSGIDLDLK